MRRSETTREVIQMAWPLAVSLLSDTLMGVVDTLAMGRIGTVPQAGVGLGATLGYLAVSFGRGLSSGPQAMVAASDGAGDRARLVASGSAGVWLGAAAGAVGTLVLLALDALALDALVGDPEVARATSEYLGVRAFAVPLTLAGMGLLAGLQGIGDTRARMRIAIVGNVANAVLDGVFIFGLGPIPALGARGAALATVLSSALMTLLYWRRYRALIGPLIGPPLEVLRRAAEVGVPAGLQGLVNVSAFSVMNVLLARAGPAHLAASQIVLQIASVSFLPGAGIGEAGGVLIGRHLGGRRPTEAGEVLRVSRILAVIVMGMCGLGFALGGRDLAGLFSHDPEVIGLAATLLLFAAGFQILDALAMVHLCALRSVGDTRFSFVLTSVCAWGVTVPLTAILGVRLGWGATAAWLGLTVEIAVLAAITGWRVGGVATGRVGQLDALLGRVA